MSKHIRASHTGNVFQIKVNVGDRVSEGTTVMILESLQMEYPVESEDDGIVRRILYREGDPVCEGWTLVELE